MELHEESHCQQAQRHTGNQRQGERNGLHFPLRGAKQLGNVLKDTAKPEAQRLPSILRPIRRFRPTDLALSHSMDAVPL